MGLGIDIKEYMGITIVNLREITSFKRIPSYENLATSNIYVKINNVSYSKPTVPPPRLSKRLGHENKVNAFNIKVSPPPTPTFVLDSMELTLLQLIHLLLPHQKGSNWMLIRTWCFQIMVKVS